VQQMLIIQILLVSSWYLATYASYSNFFGYAGYRATNASSSNFFGFSW
jgi:hypothetical protein